MTPQEKIETFRLELDYIKDPKIKKFTEQIISRLPDYFFEIAAASKKGNHPSFALGEGGLVRHTICAARFALELFRCNTVTGQFSDNTKDIIIASLLLHDGCKHGIEQTKYRVDHPLEVVRFCNQQTDIKENLDDESFKGIMDGIATHMGQWNTEFGTNREVLEKPKSGVQKFIHMCDYLASRHCIGFDFDASLSK
jgi:hypothetical protein